MVNSKKLKDKAKSMGIRQQDIAMELGLKQSTVNQKLNNVRPMGLEEAEKLAQLLKIPNEEFSSYFFASGVA